MFQKSHLHSWFKTFPFQIIKWLKIMFESFNNSFKNSIAFKFPHLLWNLDGWVVNIARWQYFQILNKQKQFWLRYKRYLGYWLVFIFKYNCKKRNSPWLLSLQLLKMENSRLSQIAYDIYDASNGMDGWMEIVFDKQLFIRAPIKANCSNKLYILFFNQLFLIFTHLGFKRIIY